MKLELRNGNVVLTLSPSELEELLELDGSDTLLPDVFQPEVFWPLARKAVADWKAGIEAAARAKDLAAQAAEACPIKVGMEVRDPRAWRNASAWWRVVSVSGTPDRPWLDTRIVRADGLQGQKQQTFGNVTSLRVRDNTEGKPVSRPLHGVPLKEIAARIHAHLRAIEAAQKRPDDARSTTRLYGASAFPSGARVSVRYVHYQRSSHLTRDEAAEYLIRLDGGFRGRHHDRREGSEDE